MTRDPHDLDLAALGTAWRNTDTPSLDDMRRGLRRQTWRMRAVLASEIGISVAGFAFGFWLMFRAQALVAVLGGFVVAYTALATWLSLRARAGGWRDDARTLVEATDLAIVRAENGLKLARANDWMTAAAGVFIAAIAVVSGLNEFADEAKLRTGLFACAGGLLFMAVWSLGNRLYEARRRRELARLKAVREQMLDD